MNLDLGAFLDELYLTLDAAAIGLNVPDAAGGVRSKGATPYLELPDVVYGAGGPGLHRIDDLGLMITFGPADNAKVFRLALDFASPHGAKSIKTLLEGHHWTTCGTLFVFRAEPSAESQMGSNPQLAYTFHLQITGG